jgi:hypothetical protein
MFCRVLEEYSRLCGTLAWVEFKDLTFFDMVYCVLAWTAGGHPAQ